MYQFNEIGSGSGSGAAALSLDGAIPRAPAAPVVPLRHWLDEARSRANEIHLVVDLGFRIGSREWFRGLATCAALCYTAWSFAPSLDTLPGRAPAPFQEAEWEQAQALSIAPLALGADTGRRMAPSDIVEPLAETPERPIVNLRATLGRGDGFARVLERAGVALAQAGEVAEMIGRVLPLDEIRPGTMMDITLGRRPNRSVPRPLDALSVRARFDLRIDIARMDGRLVLTRVPIAVDDTPLRIQGVVGSSLYRSARAAGVPARIIESYIRALSTQISVPGDLNSDDSFDFIIEHRRAETGETETGKLLFAGLDRRRGKDLQLMQWELGDRAQWFEASGVGRESGMLLQPVPGRITSSFGRRMHPILGYARMHRGIDFRAASGTPILAAAEGRITLAGWNGGYGRTVRINHAGGLSTLYAHMSRIAVSNGARVRQGQVIGYVGSSGLSTGPHLHYELYRNGAAINPRSVRFTTRAQLSGRELASFRGELRRLLNTPIGPRTEQASTSANSGTSAASTAP